MTTTASRIIKSFEQPVIPGSVILTRGLFGATDHLAYVTVIEVLSNGYRVDHTGVPLRLEGVRLSGSEGVYLSVDKTEPWKVPAGPRVRRTRRSQPAAEAQG